MGVATRPYMQRPIDPAPTATGTVPAFTELADALRCSLKDVLDNCPVTSIQEFCALADAADNVRMLHAYGRAVEASQGEDD